MEELVVIPKAIFVGRPDFDLFDVLVADTTCTQLVLYVVVAPKEDPSVPFLYCWCHANHTCMRFTPQKALYELRVNGNMKMHGSHA